MCRGGEKTKPIQSQFAGEMEPVQAIPKAYGFEAATRRPTANKKGRFEKTKPIYFVLCTAYCGKEFEKTKPICQLVELA